jgi:hypothetical protein
VAETAWSHEQLEPVHARIDQARAEIARRIAQ